MQRYIRKNIHTKMLIFNLQIGFLLKNQTKITK